MKSKPKPKPKSLYPPALLQVLLVVDLFLEAIIVFFLFVELMDLAFGNRVMNGYEIYGWAAATPPLLVVVYFVVMHYYLGGTIASRLNRWLESIGY